MVNEYIRKQDVVDYCKALMNAEVVQNTYDWGYGKERYNQTEVILNFIENRQSADVVSVRHGYWIDCGCSIKCSECGHDMPFSMRNYCPKCGARMDGKEPTVGEIVERTLRAKMDGGVNDAADN